MDVDSHNTKLGQQMKQQQANMGGAYPNQKANMFPMGRQQKNLSEQDANIIDARQNLTIDQQMKMFPPMVNTLFLEKEIEANVSNSLKKLGTNATNNPLKILNDNLAKNVAENTEKQIEFSMK